MKSRTERVKSNTEAIFPLEDIKCPLMTLQDSGIKIQSLESTKVRSLILSGWNLKHYTFTVSVNKK